MKRRERIPKINAIVSQRYEKAIEEVEARDFSEKPFAGVPIFSKGFRFKSKLVSRQQRVLAYLQVIMLRKQIIMLRNLRNWALLF